ncbi:invertase [Clostridium polyendosporum]|uniref:Sucrose-6-phosphate hydrolase n=1 Tax=Clostridium polyendosporum TaxID=69208 RepID=A0A919VE73_9CLOT|nr:glycoside hydrolase family 32 protein [Clostridium polyendosporum]GIM28829.1 invertase [Clostridium polyendosporum]
MYTVKNALEYIKENTISVKDDCWKLGYHIMPPVGWLNDPNGLIQYNDEYHVFYQYYPYGAEWGPMHWGHVKSKDLVNWEQLQVALAPDQPYEKGCFSGSAVDNDGELTLVYTAHDDDKNPKETQCIATSRDGINFTKYENNPVIPNPPEDGTQDFRDPKVWKHEDKWYMVVGNSSNGKGRVLLYYSEDLREWNYKGVIAESDGTLGDMWECPDLFKLGDKYVLVVSPMNMENHKNIYIIGDLDYETGKFIKESYHEIDYGQDFYAAQTFLDNSGRRILIGWMNMWRTKIPTQRKGWAGALTLPRELKLSEDGTVTAMPIEEVKLLRKTSYEFSDIKVTENEEGYLKEVKGKHIEMEVTFDISNCTASKFGILLRASKDHCEGTYIVYDMNTQEIIVDRAKSGEGECCITTASLPLNNSTLKLRAFIDSSSLEVFCNEGEVVLSNRIYPNETNLSIDLFSKDGDVNVGSFKAWELKSIW